MDDRAPDSPLTEPTPNQPANKILDADAPRPSDARSTAMAVFAFLIPLGPLLCVYYQSRETAFYYWDFAGFHNLARRALAAFDDSLLQGFHTVRESLNDDYNALFTLPLLPFMELFDSRRDVYLCAVFLVYFAPLLFLCGATLKRMIPESGNTALWVGAVVTFLLPNYWWILVRGYPDTGGAMLIASAVLLHIRRFSGIWRWRSTLLMGVVLGTSILFRRHYIYAVAAFYAAMGLDTLGSLLASTAQGYERAKDLLHRAAHLAGAAVASIALVAGIAPSFFLRASKVPGSGIYKAWEISSLETAASILHTVGAIPALVAIAGGLCVRRRHPGSRHAIRFVTLLTLAWLAVWIFVVRQKAYHYPHVVPFVVCLGISALLLSIAWETRAGLRVWSSGIISALIVCLFLQGATRTSVFAPLRELPRGVVPRDFQTLRNPAYRQLAELVSYLREVSGAGSGIVVAASSAILNFDVLINADSTLFPDERRLNFLATPQADSVGTLPTDQLLSTDFVIVATPFQYHLDPNKQKVVRILVDAFIEHWEIADDFELLPREFDLPMDDGAIGKIRIWRRIRETPAHVAKRSARRFSTHVFDKEPGFALWSALSSPFPASVSNLPDGTARFTGHPASLGMHSETIFEATPIKAPTARISGIIVFLDERCAGAELVASTDAPDSVEVPIGVFTPGQDRSVFELALQKTAGRAIRLLVRSNPDAPRNIDFCTLLIDDLRVEAD